MNKYFQGLKKFSGYVKIDDDANTSRARNIDQIIIYKVLLADIVITIVEKSEEEDDTTLILLVTNALDRVNE